MRKEYLCDDRHVGAVTPYFPPALTFGPDALQRAGPLSLCNSREALHKRLQRYKARAVRQSNEDAFRAGLAPQSTCFQ